MRNTTRWLPRLAVTSLAVGVLAAVSAGAASATPTAKQLYKALLKGPAAKSLPNALTGSKTQGVKLSAGSRKHHAVGAVEIGNSAAIVGFLVFPTRALALADLKAYPPNQGPNKIVSTTPSGLPRPAYILRAKGNGYVAAYAVYVLNNMIVNAWAYGKAGSDKLLRSIVEADARWAKGYGLGAVRRAA
jgi:hypothetical protein